MNPIVSILQSIVRTINSMIDSIDIRTQQSIKEGFFFLVFLSCIGAMICGYNLGKHSAKSAGKPYAEKTNDAFDLDIKIKKEPGSFQSMLESALLEQRQELTQAKVPYPSHEDEAMIMPIKPVDIPHATKETQRPLSPLQEDKLAEHQTYTDTAVIKPLDTQKKQKQYERIMLSEPKKKVDLEQKESISIKTRKELKPMDIQDKVFEQ